MEKEIRVGRHQVTRPMMATHDSLAHQADRPRILTAELDPGSLAFPAQAQPAACAPHDVHRLSSAQTARLDDFDLPGAPLPILLDAPFLLGSGVAIRIRSPELEQLRAAAREAMGGEFSKRPRPGIRSVRGHLRARHLRQHEDRSGDDLRRQTASLQSPLHADVQPLSRRSGRMHAGIRLGRSRTRLGLSGSASSCHGCGSKPSTS